MLTQTYYVTQGGTVKKGCLMRQRSNGTQQGKPRLSMADKARIKDNVVARRNAVRQESAVLRDAQWAILERIARENGTTTAMLRATHVFG